MTRSSVPLPGLFAALGVLALNDHVLKPLFHDALTGKLSDFAGCFALPLVIALSLSYLTKWSLEARVHAGAAFTVLFFSLIKLSQGAADQVAQGLEWLGAPLHLGAMHIVADPTDLLALPMVALAVRYALRSPAPRQRLGPVVLSVAALSFVATSRAPGPCKVETLNVRANTTCGAEANLSLTSTTSCSLTAGGAAFGGLPGTGSIRNEVPDGGMGDGFNLSSFDADAGTTRTCTATPDGGVFDLSCRDCSGGGSCSEVCSGTLTPQ